MTNKIKNICVFASSSNSLDEIYLNDARELGLLIARNNYNIVYGGSRRGLMYACAGAVKELGGKVCGIMPEKIALNFNAQTLKIVTNFILQKG